MIGLKRVFFIESEEKMNNTRLVMRLGQFHFCFAVINPEATRVDQLAYYTHHDPIDEMSLMELYQLEDALRHSYPDVRLAFDYPYSILVPAYHSADFPLAQAMELQFGSQGPVAEQAEAVRGWQLENQYTVPQAIMEWIRSHFARAKITHGYTADLCRVDSTDFEGALSIDFRADEFTLLASRSSKLLLTQTYTYESPADVLYYVLRAARQFGFSQQDVRVSLSGLIEKESSLYRELYQYFIHLRFRDAGWQMPDSAEAMPPHFFTALFDLATCG